MEYLTLLAIPVTSILFGYLYGKDLPDPDTKEGKLYYTNGEQ